MTNLQSIQQEALRELEKKLRTEFRKWYKGHETEAPNDYLISKIMGLFSHHLSLAYEAGVEETIKFMKGKIISMPVGSNPPLVMPEALVRSFLLPTPKPKKEKK